MVSYQMFAEIIKKPQLLGTGFFPFAARKYCKVLTF